MPNLCCKFRAWGHATFYSVLSKTELLSRTSLWRSLSRDEEFPTGHLAFTPANFSLHPIKENIEHHAPLPFGSALLRPGGKVWKNGDGAHEGLRNLRGGVSPCWMATARLPAGFWSQNEN